MRVGQSLHVWGRGLGAVMLLGAAAISVGAQAVRAQPAPSAVIAPGGGLSGPVYVYNAAVSSAQVDAYELSNGTNTASFVPPGSINGRGIAVDPDGEHVWVSWVTSNFTGDGLIHELNLTDGSEARTIADPGGSGGPGIGAMDFDPTTGHLWAASYLSGGQLYEIDTGTGAVIKQCTPAGSSVGNDTLAFARPSDLGGRLVLLTDFGEENTTLDAIDPATCTVVTTYTTPIGLTGIDEDPTTGHLVATSASGDTIYDLGMAPYTTIVSSFPAKVSTEPEDISLVSGAALGPPPPTLGNGDYQIVGAAQEPSLAVDPQNPKHVVVGYNSVGGLLGRNTHCGWATSWDGGKTWSNKGTLGSVGGQGSKGDPAVEFAPDGSVFFACLTERTNRLFGFTNNGVGIYKSSDGGTSFSGVSLADASLRTGRGVGSLDDQESLAIGSDGKLHVCAIGFNSSSAATDVEVIDSTDATGSSWLAPRIIGRGTDTLLGCGIAVTGSGRVWIAWWDSTTKLAMAAYRDSGRRFTEIGSIGAKDADSESGNQIRLSADPTPHATGVIATWPTSAFGHVVAVVQYTTDTVWRGDCGVADATLCVLSNSTLDISEPAISWGADGKILVGYYEHRSNGLTYRIGRAAALNAPFGEADAASQPTVDSTTVDSPFGRLGDYTSVAEASDGSLYASWSDTRSRSQTLWGAS